MVRLLIFTSHNWAIKERVRSSFAFMPHTLSRTRRLLCVSLTRTETKLQGRWNKQHMPYNKEWQVVRMVSRPKDHACIDYKDWIIFNLKLWTQRQLGLINIHIRFDEFSLSHRFHSVSPSIKILFHFILCGLSSRCNRYEVVTYSNYISWQLFLKFRHFLAMLS